MLPKKRNSKVPGKVITFYSYKGGVGRSFIMANVASQLALWGFRVLCVDWDLEAPGLTDYFVDEVDEDIINETDGIVDLILKCQETGNPLSEWRDTVVEVPLIHRTEQGFESCLDLISAGKGTLGAEYIENVQKLNWELLYSEHDFAKKLDDLKNEWKNEYDVIFLDSRTGISDVSGICTVQLPDILALVLTPNKQSLDGIFHVANRAVKSHARYPLSEEKLLTVPIISRLDQRDEIAIAESWLARINKTLAPLYESWLNKDVSVQRIQEFTKVPYITRWSFGESLAVLRERGSDFEQISYSFHSLAALLILGIDHSAKFTRNRDEFVNQFVQERPLKKEISVTDPLAHRLLESRSASLMSAYAKELQDSSKNLDDAAALWAKASLLEPNNEGIQRGYLDFLQSRQSVLKGVYSLVTETRTKINLSRLINEMEGSIKKLKDRAKPIKVYISYSHDSDQHKEFVLQLSDQLRGDGIDCVIDQYINGFPPEGWTKWMLSQVNEADFVLMIFTKTYNEYYQGLYTRRKGLGLELKVTQEQLVAKPQLFTKFIPIFPEHSGTYNIPSEFEDYKIYKINDEYDMLYKTLTRQSQYALPPIGKLKL